MLYYLSRLWFLGWDFKFNVIAQSISTSVILIHDPWCFGTLVLTSSHINFLAFPRLKALSDSEYEF